jgi:hypothetical protein
MGMMVKKKPGAFELMFLVVPVILFELLLIGLIRLLGFDSLILAWIAAIFTLAAIIALLAVLVIGKFALLNDNMHLYKVRQKHRELDLEMHKKRVAHPYRAHKIYY